MEGDHCWVITGGARQGYTLSDLETQLRFSPQFWLGQKNRQPRLGQDTRHKAKTARTTAPCERPPQRNCPTDLKRGSQIPRRAWNRAWDLWALLSKGPVPCSLLLKSKEGISLQEMTLPQL